MNRLALCQVPPASTVSSGRRGVTLIELMIAVTLTLLIVAVMVRAFNAAGDEIAIGRARLDMHNQLRMVTETLRRDLQNATCQPRARGQNDERTGYFEYVEGPEFDLDHSTLATDSFVGDHDDVLSLTVRSEGRPFRGRYNGADVESYLAEVVWFIVRQGADDYSGDFRLYRRVLLIRPDLAPIGATPADFFEANDVSAYPEGGNMVMNSLEDLADRRNRYAHDRSTFPHELQNGIGTQSGWLSERVLGIDGGDGVADPTREGQDLMLAGCVGFDIKAFDPTAPVKFPPGTDYMLDPNDPGYAASTVTTTDAGGYVDLGNGTTGTFAAQPFINNYVYQAATWCTWFAGYESDGEDNDLDTLIDEGANGIDDDGANGVDDTGERESQAPYAFPIRSVQISVRMIEKNTNQVLQKTIKESYVPN